MHGSHHVAQKLRRTEFPLRSCKLTVLPFGMRNSSLGAKLKSFSKEPSISISLETKVKKMTRPTIAITGIAMTIFLLRAIEKGVKIRITLLGEKKP
jgi:hypothetical protein